MNNHPRHKSILITGVAGSGKSTVCDELNRIGQEAYGIEDIDGLFAMVDKKTGEKVNDPENNSPETIGQRDWLCDKNKLQELIRNSRKKITFYCGTASNLDNLLPLFDKILLLKASPELLRKRLSAREPTEYGHSAEVQQWILSWKNWWEDHMIKQGALVIDADKKLQETTTDIIKRCESFE